MVKAGSHVLVDTNVIIEAHRTGCWKGLVDRYRLDTVEKCIEECATGDQQRRDYVPVDVDALQESLDPKKMGTGDIARLQMEHPCVADLDPGEKHLLAYATALEGAWLLCSPDRAAVLAGLTMGLLDRYIALEDMVSSAGIRVVLRKNYTRKWLGEVKTTARLGRL